MNASWVRGFSAATVAESLLPTQGRCCVNVAQPLSMPSSDWARMPVVATMYLAASFGSPPH